MPVTVFFYGSFRRGESKYEAFKRDWPGGIREVATGHIAGVALVDMGSYPSTIPAEAQSVVHGDVYEVTDQVFTHVEAIEASEGYQKHEVDVHIEGRPPIRASYFAFGRPGEIHDRPRIPGGDWRRR